ncbi:asparagine synthase-related protein [Allomuricauda sp. d1]|uniref:asparagine synthase-related protein n=1 Tax=Allomuricauda sp. d1 TaxID=3136725 RepID=UPI0031DB6468
MRGFNISIGSSNEEISRSWKTQTNPHNCIAYKDIYLENFSNNKFENDSLFTETTDYIIVLKGVILNQKALLKPNLNWEETLIELYLREGNEFFKKFKGSFCGALYDKKKEKWLVFTDHIGSRDLYYYKKGDTYFISSEINEIYAFLKANNRSYGFNIAAAYNLLSYGYMLGNKTLCEDIHKIMPGNYLRVEDGSTDMTNYYQLPKSKLEGDINEDEVIEILDTKFREAIRLQFDKDREYSYKHLVTLSGGLDSRMVAWVAHEMGYVNQINLTFSQSDYLDETIAKKIAADLKHEWIFKALDNGNFLKDIDEITKISGGHVLYYGLAHSHSIYKYINSDILGMTHSGQLGDVVIGSYIGRLNNEDLKTLGGKFSKGIEGKNPTNTSFDSFEDLELAMLYQRGLNGINEGLKIGQINSETISPFYDVDFMEFCLDIPIKNRMNHGIYLKWLLSKYPEAANYKWEKINRKPSTKQVSINYKGRQMPLRNATSAVLHKLGLKSSARSTKNHMNPLEYWYNTNNDLRTFQDTYFKVNIERITDRELKSDCQNLYNSGNAIEKNQVLTLLSAIKLNF